MAVILVLLGFGLMALIQVPPLWQKKRWGDCKVYGVIYLLALFTAISYALNWPIFSPVKLLTLLMNTIYQYLGYHVPPQ
ncbi:hypothetical protein REC12_16505 [Desulfosporosinus sp. PR]|uniref:hypothetical protein n=1 Tax=Candidatus Desulfosporosinus nitrosoreducens TaxID=3401928 RepID=UPI0027FE9AE0|nr:hypothetical protein [Desulfosporosinus sp. PR]MDQ7095200.1 hypothetical protein [Desulfosporosinus sp. PR]